MTQVSLISSAKFDNIMRDFENNLCLFLEKVCIEQSCEFNLMV